MHVDLADLRLFVHVAEAGSITAGAASAGLALASASERLRGMEAQAGVPLLERGRRGITLTPPGSALLRHARLVLGQVERMRGELGEYARRLKGRIRLLANTAALAGALPDQVAQFLAAHPNVDIALDERPSVEIARLLSEDAGDLGIAADHADLSGLETWPWQDDRLVVIAPAHHEIVSAGPLTFADVLAHDLVGLAGDMALGGHLAGHATRAGRRLKTRVQVRSLDAACRMVAGGAGLAIVPECAARGWDRAGTLALITLAEGWAERRLVLLTRDAAALPAHARQLLAHLSRPRLTTS